MFYHESLNIIRIGRMVMRKLLLGMYDLKVLRGGDLRIMQPKTSQMNGDRNEIDFHKANNGAIQLDDDGCT